MNKLAINNPKRVSDNDVKVNWYNYYAGFSNSFVKDILLSSALNQSSVVLDPWNGAGTTTTTVSEAGFTAIGVDLNPAMCVIARAKSAAISEIEIAYIKTSKMRVSKFNIEISQDDFLLNWFNFETAKYIRYLSKLIIGSSQDVTCLGVERCIMLVALFNVVRNAVQSFVPSNPTWIKKAKSESEKAIVSSVLIKKGMLSYLQQIKQSVNSKGNEERGDAHFFVASSKKLPIKSNTIDLVITSPPYCTRIDYGVATYPELAVLFGDTPDKINRLRRELIGRTTIDKNLQFHGLVSCELKRFMDAVEQHVSHASSNYYLKNYKQYFMDIQKSLTEISRVVKDEGVFVCVVQDSYYKEVYCNLALIFTEIAAIHGFKLIDQRDFNAKIIMASINAGTKKYRSKVTATESVLVFKKQGTTYEP